MLSCFYAFIFRKFGYVINKGLRIMDSTASTISMDNDIDLVVFNMNEPGNIKRVVFGENIGTTVSNNVEK